MKASTGYRGIDLSVIADIRNAMSSMWPSVTDREVEDVIDYMMSDYVATDVGDVDYHILKHMPLLWRSA